MEMDRAAQFTRRWQVEQGDVEFHLLLPVGIQRVDRSTLQNRAGEQRLNAVIQPDDDFHFVEFTGRNQLSGENPKRERSTGDILLVPNVSRFVASSAELYEKRRSSG